MLSISSPHADNRTVRSAIQIGLLALLAQVSGAQGTAQEVNGQAPTIQPRAVPAQREQSLQLAPHANASLTAASSQKKVTKRQPSPADPAADGKVYEWTASNGQALRYRVPENYDTNQGAHLTLILHGSNLSRTWGFANHNPESFRVNDILVSPDGTTPNGNGGFNSLGESADVKKTQALLKELKSIWNVRRTFLYGHSQGSFFALHYAGAHPDDIDGVVAHASGMWNWSDYGKKGHHQAIVLHHGTQDPVVPYSQSVGAYEALRGAKYPMLRLRSLEGWNHWPTQHNFNHLGQAVPHTGQQLAWVQGMTATDPEELKSCLEELANNSFPQRHDYAAVYTLADHIAELDDLPVKLRKRAQSLRKQVDELAKDHIKTMKLPKKLKWQSESWVGHLPLLLRTFDQVPARDALAKKIDRDLKAQFKLADKASGDFWSDESKKPERAFATGLDLVEKGFLTHRAQNGRFLERLKAIHTQASQHKLSKKDLKRYDPLVEDYADMRKRGAEEFDRVNAGAKLKK